MFPLTEWFDRDDVTAEDLVPLTAEVEVLDWMRETPVPEPRRPEWLPSSEARLVEAPRPARPRSPRPVARKARISRDIAPPRPTAGAVLGWVAGTLVVAGLLALSFMASAVGVVFVTLV